MKLIRVEHPEGYGPHGRYLISGAKSVNKPVLPNHLRAHENVDAMKDSRFAFTRVRNCRRYLTLKEIKTLIEAGYVLTVYDVPRSKVLKDDFQAVFDRAVAKKLATIPLKSLARRKRHYT